MYRKILFYAFLLAAIFSLDLMFQGQAKSQSKSLRNYYIGTIGDKYKIMMDLTIEKSKVNGSYSYYTQGKTISLTGDVDAKGNFNLNESSNEKVTGVLKGSFIDSFNGIKGEWSSIDGKKKLPLSLEKAAEYITLHDKEYNVSVSYPEFKMKNFTQQKELNECIAKTMKGYLDSGRVSLKEAIEDADDDSSLVSQYSYETSGTVDYISESLASILCTGYVYSGGAHPTFYYFSLNYYLKSGSVKEIKLAELFKPKTNYAKLLSGLCIEELKHNKVPSVMSGEIKDISEEIKKGSIPYTILPAGLKFYFSPYTVGSYAEGSFDCIIKYSKLKSVINSDGVLSEFEK